MLSSSAAWAEIVAPAHKSVTCFQKPQEQMQMIPSDNPNWNNDIEEVSGMTNTITNGNK